MAANIVLFESSDGDVTLPVQVDYANAEVWLSKEQMAQLFDRDRSVITRHIANIYKEGELEKKQLVHFLHKFAKRAKER